MALFRKKRRDVGVYSPPPRLPLAPVDEVVEDALNIAHHGVRMAVKNHLIVSALREGKPFDVRELEDVARGEYRELAHDSREAAERAQDALDHPNEEMVNRVYPGGMRVEIGPDRQRKPEVLRAVADAYDGAAHDTESLAELVEEAKRAAWQEIGDTLAARLMTPRLEDDPDYLAFRDERVARFIHEDLGALRRRARRRSS